jgi:hypothetical protein
VLATERASEWGMGGARLMDRGQLVDALDKAVTRRVILISAPLEAARRRCCAPGLIGHFKLTRWHS